MIIKKPLVVRESEIRVLIRDLRLLAGLTQEQFAAYLGVTYTTINRWENGRSKPSPIAMRLIEQKLEKMGEQGKDFETGEVTQSIKAAFSLDIDVE